MELNKLNDENTNHFYTIILIIIYILCHYGDHVNQMSFPGLQISANPQYPAFSDCKICRNRSAK